MSDQFNRRFQGLARSYVGFSHRRPWTALSILGAVTLVAIVLAAQIRIRTDLRLLLPSDAPSVQALGLSEKRLGSTDFFTVAFEDSSAEKVGRFQKALAESLSVWNQVQWVQHDEDLRFFERHSLLYLPVAQLADLEARLRAMARESKIANPLSLDLLGDSSDAPASLEGWPDKLSLYKQGIPMDVVQGLLHQIEQESGGNQAEGSDGGPLRPMLPDSLKYRMVGYHAEKGMWVGVVMAQLRIPSTEADFATVAKLQGERLSLAVQKSLGMRIHSAVVGAYRDPSTELEEIGADMWISSVVAIVLILGLLLYYMRKPGNVAVVFVPLLVAMAWMMGAAELVYGRLTVLTSFVLALLSGLGIEYGIHLYSRWMEERRRGSSVEESMAVSVGSTGRSLVSAMAASISCMLAMLVGHFPGFKEFGIVVSMGIFLAFLSSLLVLPPLLFATLAWGRKLEASRFKRFAWIVPCESNREGAILVPTLSWSKTTIRGLFAVSMAITLFLALSPRVGFENDFGNLRGGQGRFQWLSGWVERIFGNPDAQAVRGRSISYGRAVGEGRNTTPSVILAGSEAQMREIHDTLGARFGGPRDSMLQSFVTIQSFVPTASVQLERMERLRGIRRLLDSDDFGELDDAARAKLATLRRYTVCGTFGFDSLPAYARRFLTESDGSHGRFGLIYGDMRESDAVESRKFQSRNGQFATSTGVVPVASSGFIYADVVQMVKMDVGRLAIAVFCFLGLVVWLDTRSWRGLLVNMGYVGLIALWTYGAMGWLGLKLGMFNIVVLPALLSNTVDATIHLYHRRMESGAGKMGEIMHNSGSSVLAGTLTNAFGFLALVVVAHQGLNTIGMLACLGYLAGILIMFLAMPFLLEVVCPKLPEGPSGDA